MQYFTTNVRNTSFKIILIDIVENNILEQHIIFNEFVKLTGNRHINNYV